MIVVVDGAPVIATETVYAPGVVVVATVVLGPALLHPLSTPVTRRVNSANAKLTMERFRSA